MQTKKKVVLHTTIKVFFVNHKDGARIFMTRTYKLIMARPTYPHTSCEPAATKPYLFFIKEENVATDIKAHAWLENYRYLSLRSAFMAKTCTGVTGGSPVFRCVNTNIIYESRYHNIMNE